MVSRVSALSQQLYQWYEEPAGQELLSSIKIQLQTILPGVFGYRGLQVGLGNSDLLSAAEVSRRYIIDTTVGECIDLVGHPEALPIRSKSMDLVLLAHSLDCADDPYQSLREANRILSDDGRLVILGFNPFSGWGVRRQLRIGAAGPPFNTRFIARFRLGDWLSMIHFQTTITRHAAPRGYWLRWWEAAAPVYILVAQKRTIPLTIMPMPSRRRAQKAKVVHAIFAKSERGRLDD